VSAERIGLKEMQQFIDDCRRPKGKTLMDEKSGLVAAH
jgi:hypothetical protein